MQSNLRICTFLFTTFFCFLLKSLCSQEINIDSNKNLITLPLSKTSYYIDTSTNQTFDLIKTLHFNKYNKLLINNYKKENTLWVKIELKNNTGFDQEYLLQTDKWGLFEAFIFSENNKISHLKSGSLLSLNKRSHPSSVNAIKLLLQNNISNVVYLKFKSDYSIYLHQQLNLSLIKQSYFNKKESIVLLWQGVFLGIILVMALYNLFILFSVKDISYLYYVLSIVSIGLYFTFYYGIGIEYLWTQSPIWDTFCFTIINPFTSLTRILFTRTYLHTPLYQPKINKILNVLAAASIATLLIGVTSYFLRYDILDLMVSVIGFLGAIVLIMMLFAGLVAYFKNNYDPAKYFIAANVLLVFGAIAFIFRETHLIDDNYITRYLVQYGVLIQAVVLSLGLGSRLNKMQLQLASETIEKEQLALEKEREKKELIEQQKIELQNQVNEKTNDLLQKNTILEKTNNQLKISENKLSELNQVKDKLFSVVSHDLRNPLATMQAFLKLLTTHSRKMSDAEKDKLYIEAQQSIDNLNELLYNLLQWSKSQMGLLQIKKEKLNVKLLFERTIRTIHSIALMKEIKINVTSEENLFIDGDKDMIEFIIRNLISNAIKFSFRDSTIELNAFSSNNKIIIEVLDFGIGISEIKIKQILGQNKAITQRGTEKEKGTGLGLLICKDFIEKNDGTLDIKSEVNRGTKICIHFASQSCFD